jgi:hypothetical protein
MESQRPSVPVADVEPVGEQPVLAEAVPMAPPEQLPAPVASGAVRPAGHAETSPAKADPRPRQVAIVQRAETARLEEGDRAAIDPGEVPAVTPIGHEPAGVTPTAEDQPSVELPKSGSVEQPGAAAEANSPAVQQLERHPTDLDSVPAPPPVQLPTPDHLGRQVSARLVVMDAAQGSRVRIELEPVDLGRVEVDLQLDDAGTAVASFTVDRPETLQLLQRDARVVNEMLAAAGFTVDQGGLDFTLRDSGGHGDRAEQRPSSRAPADGAFAGEAQPGDPPPHHRPGLLDLRV